MRKRTYTISEAAELTGLSRKAVARRTERGSLRSLVRGGRRVIPLAELVRAGLLPAEGEAGVGDLDASGLLPRELAPAGREDSAQSSLVALVRDLFDRLERQAGEIGQFRALTAQAESLRLAGEMAELRARVAELEGGGRRPLALEPGGHDAQLAPGPPEHVATAPGYAQQAREEGIWLPPNARGGGPRRAGSGLAYAPAGEPPAPARSPGSARHALAHTLALLAEAAFIVAVAAGAWYADLGIRTAVAVVALAWVLVAVIEWARWRRRSEARRLD